MYCGISGRIEAAWEAGVAAVLNSSGSAVCAWAREFYGAVVRVKEYEVYCSFRYDAPMRFSL